MSKKQITHEEAATELLIGKQIVVKIHDSEFTYKFVIIPGEASHLAIFFPDGREFSERVIGRADIPKICAEAAQAPHVTFWIKGVATQEQA